MTFSLALQNGDLALQGSSFGIVSGTAKLQQDMSLWLTERLGVDRFHPRYGSQLPDFIGGVIDLTTQSKVQSEVDRVLGNYQAIQMAAFQNTPQLFSFDEMLSSLNAVNVNLTYDTVSVAVAVTTGSGALATTTTTSSV
jgi:phage baseplate assembly protein W